MQAGMLLCSSASSVYGVCRRNAGAATGCSSQVPLRSMPHGKEWPTSPIRLDLQNAQHREMQNTPPLAYEPAKKIEGPIKRPNVAQWKQLSPENWHAPLTMGSMAMPVPTSALTFAAPCQYTAHICVTLLLPFRTTSCMLYIA